MPCDAQVYFRLGALESLEERRGRVLSTQAAVIQRYYRGWRQRHLFTVLRKAAVRIQSHARQWSEAARCVVTQSSGRNPRKGCLVFFFFNASESGPDIEAPM